MGRGRTVAATVVLAAALAVSSCTADGVAHEGSDPGNPHQVEALTWWTSEVDRTGLHAMVQVLNQREPGIQFIDASVTGGPSAAHAALQARLDAGNPPDTFLATAGATLRGYVDDAGLQDLGPFFRQYGLTQTYPPALLELLSVDGAIYGVPSDVHRSNVLWTDNDLLRAAGLEPADVVNDLDDWIADLEQVQRSGVDYPLALGDAFSQLQLFENVLLADLGAPAFIALWTDADGWTQPAIDTAIAHYDRLLDFVAPGVGSRDTDRVIQQVVTGQAAYLVMADHVQAAFERAGMTLGVQYSAWPTPGTADAFGLVADAFVLPVGAAHPEAARDWLLTVASLEAQRRLSATTGSIPALLDAASAEYAPYQSSAITALQVQDLVPSLAFGVAADRRWTRAITDAVERFGVDRHPDALKNALLSAADAAVA